ncbi:Double Clp-N motif-containing P-loop nucleoside triphosphate hydrolases superfamily protein [Euphorbia peplus]|nr:Double Clp-N motif-containing P-loop nucleoside triphosphate hydrolases superfamily protein [Euphorbia peplus]
MRAGICSVNQSLTVEALSIVKQAVSLARRRGHAQVTPLHVASAMLASSNGLLRRACLQSHSHPLQCKALELCFNVALNRLPASTSNALLGPHSSHPSLSNALVAAFKRAQAHQRRGSIENQQQPILALKIEIEQFIISILDDPSVSRVMREAGFSSTQVKNNVEQVVSLEICSPNTTPTSTKDITKPLLLNTTTMSRNSLPFSQFGSGLNKPFDYHQVSHEDAMSVLNTLVDNKKRNMVITGECSATIEGVVREVMEKIERGVAPGELRFVRFVSFPLYSLRDQSREEVEQKLVELRCIVKSYLSSGVVLYLGDLKWISDSWSNYGEQRRSYYCSGEHIIMEIKRLIRGIGETGKLWLMGSATFQTYMKCKAGHPSLETIWELYPLTIPLGSLGLSLNLDHSNLQSQSRNKASTYQTIYCRDFSANFDGETESIGRDTRTKEFISGSSLPLWLQKHKDMTRRTTMDDKEHCSTISSPVFKRWNSFGSSIQKEPNYHQKTIKFASSPPSPISISSHECNTSLNQLSWPLIFEPENLSKEKKIWLSDNEVCESNLMNLSKPDLLSNPNSSPNSASSSEAIDDEQGMESFKEYNDQNLNILCSSLEKKVPWQKDIIPEIAETILECRSRQSKKAINGGKREEAWLFFLGLDAAGKQKIARELARVVFGSHTNLVSINSSNFLASTRADSSEESSKRNKRGREDHQFGCTNHYERLGLALNENPHRVFLIEDVEQIDFSSRKALKEAIRSGKLSLSGGESVPLRDAIIIFICESSSAVSRACSPLKRAKISENDEIKEEEDQVVSLDLNISIEVDDRDHEYSNFSQDGILHYVDRQIIFKLQEF